MIGNSPAVQEEQSVVVFEPTPLMKLFRLALTALISALFVVPALAQYPMAWSAFRDLGLHSSEQAMKMLNAPGGGGFILFGDTGGASQAIVRVDDTGAMLWNRM